MRRLGLLALAALLAACTHRSGRPVAPASSAGARLAIAVADGGRLLLEIPPGWTATPGEAEPPLPATLRLEPPAGHFFLLLTPAIDPTAAPGAPASAEQAKELVDLARRKAAETSLESPLALLELGGGARGWYFAATDRELGPGGRKAEPDEFRCLVQGAAAVGGVTLAFALLDDGDGPQRAEALEVVRRARHQPPLPPEAGEAKADPEARPGPAARPDPSGWRVAADGPVTLAFPGNAWAVAVDLPGFRVAEPQVRSDGSMVSLLGEDARTGLVASITLTAADGRRSAAACAETDWRRIGAAVPEVARRPPPSGEPPRAEYLVRQHEGKQVDQQNVSAWWHREGVCIHVHLSLMGYQAGDRPVLERILASVRYDEAL